MTFLDELLYKLFGEIIRKPIEREVDNQLGTNFDFTSLRRVFLICIYVEREGNG